MSIDPLIFFDIIAALFILAVALAAMAISYSQLVRKQNSNQKKYDEILNEINRKDVDFLEDARQKGAQIIEGSTKKAQQIIEESQTLSSEYRKQLDEALETLIKHQTSYFEKASQDFLSEYKKELDSLKARAIEVAQNTSKDIEEDTEREIKEFDNVLAQETFSAQKIVEGKIEEEYSTAQKEVEAYRQEMMKKLEGQIYKILEDVSKMAIGKSISLADHEQLIIDALEKAKKDGIQK
ncbi:MAG: hypothetical protein A3C22_03175 [Candidatus Levybacteria bacterium RIFCSPHIGHO2_02_FULL_37_10]|nr:MAG: hypothetical protein A3C22_03175 [Candidatus Levybacteria bacterium RIFCSPHIGHO2_02_FULL_37_10]